MQVTTGKQGERRLHYDNCSANFLDDPDQGARSLCDLTIMFINHFSGAPIITNYHPRKEDIVPSSRIGFSEANRPEVRNP